MVRGVKDTQLGPFVQGMNNVLNERDVPADVLREALNVDIDKTGDVRTRTGYTKLASLTNAHSLYSNGSLVLIVDGGQLKLVDPATYALTALTAVHGEVNYADVQGTVYYSDSDSIGRVLGDGTATYVWTPPLDIQPTVSSSSNGSLTAGKYQLAVTTVGVYGEESGCLPTAAVTVTDDTSIVLNGLQTTGDFETLRIYMTPPGGEIFYMQAEIPKGASTVTLFKHITGRVLETMYMEPMPPGDILCYHYGRLYVVKDEVIYFSEPLKYGLTRVMDDYLPPFSEPIKILLSHPTGLFVVADKTYFLNGQNPEEMTSVVVYPYSAVKGTGLNVPASLFGLEVFGNLPFWFSDNGPVIGFDGGQIIPLTEDRLAVDQYVQGAALLREENGIRSVLTAVRDKENVSRLGATDSVSFEIRRNGVVIPP